MLYIDPLAAAAPSMPDSDDLRNKFRERKALEELEHLFISMLMKEMRNSVPTDGLFGESTELRTYTEMFDDAASAEMAKAGQFGIAKMMEQQLRMREMQEQLARTPDGSGLKAPIPLHPMLNLRVPASLEPGMTFLKNAPFPTINDNRSIDLGPGV